MIIIANALQNDVLRPVQTTLNGDEVLSYLKYNQQDLVQTKFLGGKMDYSGPHAGVSMEGFLQKVDYRYDGAGKLLEINSPAESECSQGKEICLLEARIELIPKESRCSPKLAKIFINGQDYPFSESFVFGVDDLDKLRMLLTNAIDYYGLTGTVQVYSSPITGSSGAGGAIYTIRIENTTVEALILEMAPSIAYGYVCRHEFSKDEKGCCRVEMPIGPGSAGVGNPLTTSNYDLFMEKIKYDHWDIERINYGSDCVSGGMRNEFKYDKNHRVTNMDNFMFKNGLMTPGVYSEQFKYENVIGDLGSLTRSSTSLLGVTDPLVPYQANNIDMLTYAYSNGRLSGVNEGGNHARGFMNNTTFTHDNNGNMLTDGGKGLTFKYNVINLPQKITGAGGTMTNIYAFSGEKVLSKGPQGERKYLGGMEFLNNRPQHYAHSEGRIQYAGTTDTEHGEIQYKIADHLGNLMVLFGDKPDPVTGLGDRKINTETAIAAAAADPTAPPLPEEIVQRHFYYAYGMEMEGPWQHTPPVRDAYMYNGKELLEDLGMNLSDYGARYYDAVIGRWTGVDSLAEKTPSGSVYMYVLGNPIGLIDPTGMSAEGSPGFPSTGESSSANSGQSRPKPVLYYVNDSNWKDTEIRQVLNGAAEIWRKNGYEGFTFQEVTIEEAMKHEFSYEYQMFLAFTNIKNKDDKKPGVSLKDGNRVGVYDIYNSDSKTNRLYLSYINLSSPSILNGNKIYLAGFVTAHEMLHQMLMYVTHFGIVNYEFDHNNSRQNLNMDALYLQYPKGPKKYLQQAETILDFQKSYIDKLLLGQ